MFDLDAVKLLAQTAANLSKKPQNIYLVDNRFYAFGPDGAMVYLKDLYPNKTVVRVEDVHPEGQEPFEKGN